jgi:signal transduction histidine kinase
MTAIWSDSQDISLSERDRIFERFYRGDSTLILKIKGSGLGLSLAREIALVYGKYAHTTTNKQSSTTNR